MGRLVHQQEIRVRGERPCKAYAADNLLAQVRLPDAGDKPIWTLSGGMRQRDAQMSSSNVCMRSRVSASSAPSKISSYGE